MQQTLPATSKNLYIRGLENLMKSRVTELTKALRVVHRMFLENERVVAEKLLQRTLDPFSFLTVLTQDKNFEWMKPFNTLLAEIDAFEDEAETITADDLLRLKKQVETLLQTPDSKIATRYREQMMFDGDLMMANAKLNQALKGLVVRND